MSKRLSLEEKGRLLTEAALREVERRGGVVGDRVDVSVLQQVMLEKMDELEARIVAGVAEGFPDNPELQRDVVDHLDKGFREVRAQIIADLAPKQ